MVDWPDAAIVTNLAAADALGDALEVIAQKQAIQGDYKLCMQAKGYVEAR